MNTSVNKINDIKKFIDEHITEDLSLDLVAAEFGISKHYLCHLFKRNTGYTVLQYIKRKRFCLMKEYFISGMSLIDAAMLAGFRSYSNFYRAYFNEFGKAPSKDMNVSEF